MNLTKPSLDAVPLLLTDKVCPFQPAIYQPGPVPGSMNQIMTKCQGRNCAAFKLCQEVPEAILKLAEAFAPKANA